MKRSVAALLAEHAVERPAAVAVELEGTALTFAELDAAAELLARRLRARGVGAGDRLAVVARNDLAFFPLLHAAAKLGAVLVPLNARLTAPEVSFMMRDAGAVLVFSDAGCAALVREASADCPALREHALFGAGGTIAAWSDPGAPPSAGSTTASAADEDRVLLQMYTSGTTGNAKGVVLTERNLLALAEGGCDELGPFTADTVSLVCMPLFHVAGLDWLMFALRSRSRIVLARDIVPPQTLALMNAAAVTSVLLVPTVIRMLVQEAEKTGLAVPSLRTLVFGASPMPTELIARARRVFPGAELIHVYGLTETSGMFSSMPVAPDRLESCGKAWRGSELRIVDPRGQVVAPGEIGEVVCRSPQLTPGYWNREDANAAVFVDGWFHTGDAGYVDEDGFLFLKDRIKDMVKSGGENVFPAEVEEVLSAHPAVAEVAVIGVPDAKWDELVVAVVRLRDGHEAGATLFAELDVFARKRLGAFKVPRRYEVVSDFPRTASAKVLKTALRRLYTGT